MKTDFLLCCTSNIKVFLQNFVIIGENEFQRTLVLFNGTKSFKVNSEQSVFSPSAGDHFSAVTIHKVGFLPYANSLRDQEVPPPRSVLKMPKSTLRILGLVTTTLLQPKTNMTVYSLWVSALKTHCI